MSPRTASRLAWSMWALTVSLLGGTLLLGVAGHTFNEAGGFAILVPIFLLAFATVGALVAGRQPGNPIGWIFCATGLAWALASLADSYAGYAMFNGRTDETLARLADSFDIWFYGAAVFAPITLLLLLFPDGRLISSRWRPILWLTVIGDLGIALTSAFDPDSTTTDARFLTSNPFGSHALAGLIHLVGPVTWYMAIAGVLAAPVAIVIRLRRSSGDERRQVAWLAYAGVIAVFTLVAAIAVGQALGFDQSSTGQRITEFCIIAALTLIPLSAGVGILKYRLYDIDVVINKTVVYGLLAAVATLIYVAIVVGIGTAVGSGGNAFLSAVAAAIVALVFQPARRWAQRLANRLVYGKRATPYEVLSGFSGRLAETYSVDDVLPRIARVLGEGLGADRVAILLRTGMRLVPVASWPHTEPAGRTEQRSFEVRHQGEPLGAVEVAMPANEPMNAAQAKLVEDVAAQAGLVLRNAALIADLRDSRRRIVTAQDERARKLERNIHDGAQQQLVALQIKVGLVERVVHSDTQKAVAMLGEVRSETNDALENLRDIARGIYPPLLADQGLAAALSAQARKVPIPVAVEPDRIGRYPEEMEAAVYFSCLEALQNVTKYAEASKATVRLTQSDGTLRFEVSDDGRGFDPAIVEHGTGLQGIADRLASLGGELDVRSAPGDGTIVAGRLPVGEERR
jgi:signal transduction histidine kinase